MVTSADLSVEAVAEALGDAITAFDDGRSAREVGCRRTAALARADLVAHAAFDDLAQVCTLTVWPACPEEPGQRLVTGEPSAGPRRSPDGVGGRDDRWRRSAAYDAFRELSAATESVALPLVEEGHTRSLAVFARRQPFAAADLRVLDLMHLPLAALEAHLRQLEEDRHGDLPLGPGGPDGNPLGLTPRELEVLRLLSRGLLASTIAAQMAVSPRTVHKHLGSVYRKLDTHDRLLAVDRARTLGLL